MNDEKYCERLFKAETGRKLDLLNPKSFNEKLNWLKLNDRKPIYTTMVDKIEGSARVIHKLLRLARTSADLDGVDKVRLEDIKRVISCRDLDESNSKMMVVK